MDLSSKLALYGDKSSGSTKTAGDEQRQAPEHSAPEPSPIVESGAESGAETGTDKVAQVAQVAAGANTSQGRNRGRTPRFSAGADGGSDHSSVASPAYEYWLGNIGLRALAEGLYYRKEVYPDLTLGSTRLGGLLVHPMQYLTDLLPSNGLHDTGDLIHRNDVLFIDTETTGLGRGPGNFPFLYGLAWIAEDGLHFEQFFLDGPGAEEEFQPMLRSRVSAFAAICSYNGKSFDIPVIRNRFILLGERFRAPPVHLDLFHFWRSVLGGMRKRKSRSGGSSKANAGSSRSSSATEGAADEPPRRSFKQKDMERDILGFERKDDLPGAEVPQVYFDYRKYGYKDRMEQVLRHNEWDLQGLALLFLKAVALVDARRDQSALFRSGVARMFLRHGKPRDSALLLQEIQSAEEDEGYDEGLLYADRLLLGLLLKRSGQWEKALNVFEALWKKYRCMQSCIELSRLFERQRGDLALALDQAVQGLELLEFRGAAENDRYLRDLTRRTRRLALRKERASGSGSPEAD